MNRIKRFFIRKHRLLLKIAIILLSTAGIILILFPIYTNIIIANKETRVLSSWEKLKDEKVQETPTEIETLPEEDISESGIIETQEQSAETTQEEIQEPPQVEYTIQDFFPLKINMPDIESEWIVNAGSDPQTLKQGPGYIIGTSLPGQPGRCAIAGHRTTYGAPFNRIDELEDGDIIYLETLYTVLKDY